MTRISERQCRCPPTASGPSLLASNRASYLEIMIMTRIGFASPIIINTTRVTVSLSLY